MPRNKDIKKVLVIGSGPIIIGQAAEFDYAGTQAKVLRIPTVGLRTGRGNDGAIFMLIAFSSL